MSSRTERIADLGRSGVEASDCMLLSGPSSLVVEFSSPACAVLEVMRLWGPDEVLEVPGWGIQSDGQVEEVMEPATLVDDIEPVIVGQDAQIQELDDHGIHDGS